jgi:DNA-binding transcriptional LysR family regulator
MYNLEQLKMFVETSESGSFSACARKLGKTQSSISQGIANLETDLGVEIFDRSTRKATLTPDGLRLINYARVVLQQSEELNSAAKSIVRKEESNVRIAVENALITSQFSQLLYEFGQCFPATEVEILSVASPDVVALVESGRVDIGVMLSDMSFKREVDLCFIGHIQLCAVCGPEHPLTKLASVDISNVAGYTQMILRGESGGELDHEASISALKWSSNSVYCIIELIMQNNGWGYLPMHLIQEYIDNKKLYKIPMRLDEKPWSPPVDLVTQKIQRTGPAVNWLIDAFKNLLD